MASRTPRSDALAGWIARQRWFAAKSRRIRAVAIADTVAIEPGLLAIVDVTLDDGRVDRYTVPLAPSADAAEVRDALDDPRFCVALVDLMRRGAALHGARGEVRGSATRAFPRELGAAPPVRRVGAEQSNSSFTVDRALIVKHFRRLAAGLNPDEEVVGFLTERTSYANTPRLAGALAYVDADGRRATLAVAQELIVDAVDGWQWLLGEIDDPARRPATLDALALLGRRTAELHLALASVRDDPSFSPEPTTEIDVAVWADSVSAQISAATSAIAAQRSGESGGGRDRGEWGSEQAIPFPAALPAVSREQIEAGLRRLIGKEKIRHHGDFHFGQTLRVPTRSDFMIIDFEGEPMRPLEERRRKHSPLRDVAGMLRSLDYAASSARAAAAEAEALAAWLRDARQGFVRGYRAASAGAEFVPDADEDFDASVAVFELEKAAYEIVYEANNRPDWLPIPLRGFTSSVSRLAASPPARRASRARPPRSASAPGRPGAA